MIRPTYRSGTLILVEQPSVPEKYVVSNIDSDIQHQLDSITQQILSRTRLLRIIDTLGLYARERKHMSEDDLVERMRKDTEIELSHGDDRNSRRSTFITRATIRRRHSGRRTNWQICSSPRIGGAAKAFRDTTNFLGDQLLQARAKLEAQEARMRVFKDQHLGELPTQTQSNLQILAGLQTQAGRTKTR